MVIDRLAEYAGLLLLAGEWKAIEVGKSGSPAIAAITWHTGQLGKNLKSESVQGRPRNQASDTPLASLVDIQALRILLDDFSAVAGMTTALLDLEGNILQSAGWQKACTAFHRALPSSCANCTESDLYLASHLQEGEFVDYKCKNGLWDVVTPVFVGKQHLGNLYCGQFFYDDDVVNESVFAAQAEYFGYDKAAYLSAIREVPRYSREYVRQTMKFMVGVASYLSHLSLANLNLEESKSQMEAFINAVPDPVWMKDKEGRYLSCNRAFERLVDTPAAEIVGKSDYDFFSREEADVFRGNDLDALAAGEPRCSEESVYDAENGRVILTETVKAPLLGSSGKPMAVIGIARDITARKRAEEETQRFNAELEQRVQQRTAELQQSNEALMRSNMELQRFAHAAAHDLRTPLRSIVGFSQLLQQKLGGTIDQEAVEWLNLVIGNTKRLQTLIDEVLAYSRLDAQVRPFETFNLREVFDQVLTTLTTPVREAGGVVSCGDLPTMMADRTQIAQLLQNLIENGIKYNRSPSPQVSITCECRDSEWVIAVADNGIGIEPKHHERIFKIFHRLHSQQEFPGSGIGLAICQRIVERHHGRLWVESEAGQGCIFYFSLPNALKVA